ncbi:putative signal peptide protein [Oceaniovalibus guishaninsula JLT2003]|uniref:Putative signal peptide protein n=1 Tax=Oceaniovalibus guishaninsula JLT2003 TaxID=1231392 RepID=K2HQI0_9RHOB|nr:imelysin family protein [Oceaniovalibus guishaninsula]EKE45059.1 putative signal peptide protein [Oceaniovalibus guishaninsula JLT2003]
MKYAVAFTIGLAIAAGSVAAGVEQAIDDQILPGYAAFSDATAALRQTAMNDCTAAAIRPDWNGAMDAWLGVGHLRFGPAEAEGRATAIAFWPDTRGATARTLADLLIARDPVIDTPEGTATLSVAARGLYALELLLYDPQFDDNGAYGCALLRALTTDLAAMAASIEDEWQNGYADALRHAGDPGNDVFLSEREARQTLFTALLTGLEFIADQRLGRPMGTFERPRPARAESWRAGRSQRNVILSLRALSGLADALADSGTPRTDAAFSRAMDLADTLDDPVFGAVVDPTGRLRVEVLQQAVRDARETALMELGPALGVSAGFNSADGD